MSLTDHRLPSRHTERQIRLLYLMHVDWHWIRQRPQALADELDQMPGFNVLACYLPKLRRWSLASNPSAVTRVPIPQLPFGRWRLVRRLNVIWARTFLWMVGYVWRPEAVLVPFPTMYRLLPRRVGRLPVFYDCMDLATGFTDDPSLQRELDSAERDLLSTSRAVFVSSSRLAEIVAKRMPTGTRPVLIRNAARPFDKLVPKPSDGDPRPIQLGYYGTISRWLDWDAVIRVLTELSDVEFQLWGPVHGNVPSHPRLRIHRPVAHQELPVVTAGCDALVMPFIPSELIQAVDPVKLYEYLFLEKAVLSIYYPELEHFAPLVNFYRNPGELVELVRKLREGDKGLVPNPAQVRSFLASSTWAERAKQMAAEIRRTLPQAPA